MVSNLIAWITVIYVRKCLFPGDHSKLRSKNNNIFYRLEAPRPVGLFGFISSISKQPRLSLAFTSTFNIITVLIANLQMSNDGLIAARRRFDLIIMHIYYLRPLE